MTRGAERGTMKRFMVVGTSCAGKTTLARRIADAVNAPHVELDALYWGPNWSETPANEFRAKVSERASADAWVIDGNYSKARDIVMARATDVVWLNYAFPLVFRRAVARTARRVVTGEELFGGNRETLGTAFLRWDSIPVWVIRTHRRRSRAYRRLFASEAVAHLRVHELTHPRGADAFVRRLEDGGATRPPSADGA